MNKRQFNKVLSMYKEGISSAVCAGMIVELNRGKKTPVGLWLDQFYKEIMKKPEEILTCLQQLKLYDLTPETALRSMGITRVTQLDACGNCGELESQCDCRAKAGQL